MKRSNTGAVELKHNGERAYYHGLQTCKSAWTCPVCARRILSGRRAEVEKILEVAGERGLSAMFVTVTLSHHSGSKLGECLDALLASWRFVFSGDKSGKRKSLARFVAQVKRLDIRFSPNSYHPHLHAIILTDENGLSEAEKSVYHAELAECIFSRYARKLEKLGFAVERQAYNAEPVDIATAASRYLSKLDMELASVDTKQSRSLGQPNYSYSMFELLGLAESGEREVYGRSIASIFREYALFTKRRRMISYSRGIEALLGQEAAADEELADEETREEDVTLAVIGNDLWRVVVKRELRAELLEVADGGDAALVERWLSHLAESASSSSPP